MRIVWVALGLWLGGCTSAAPAEREVAHPVLAVAVPQVVVAAAPPNVRIIIGGDVIPHRPQLAEPESVSAALAPLAQLFHSADAAIVNYETATGEIRHARPTELALGAKPGWMHAVASANVTGLTLANNHACDLGPHGLAGSLEDAGTEGLTAIGADSRDPWAPKTLVERDGQRVCAVAWTTFVNNGACADGNHLAVARPDHEGRTRAVKAIARAFHEGCDAVIAIVHGGDEYAPQTHPMMTLARAVADAGADAVVMHHPHVVSPLVVYETEDGRRVPIFASLGNLVSNQGESWTPAFPAAQKDRHVVYMNGWTRVGMLADLELSLRAGGPQRVVAFGAHLVYVENDHALDKSNPRPRIVARTLDPEADRAVIEKLSRDAAGPRAVFEDPCWIERRGGAAASGPVPGCR